MYCTKHNGLAGPWPSGTIANHCVVRVRSNQKLHASQCPIDRCEKLQEASSFRTWDTERLQLGLARVSERIRLKVMWATRTTAENVRIQAHWCLQYCPLTWLCNISKTGFAFLFFLFFSKYKCSIKMGLFLSWDGKDASQYCDSFLFLFYTQTRLATQISNRNVQKSKPVGHVLNSN
jgi:hypothetical protein